MTCKDQLKKIFAFIKMVFYIFLGKTTLIFQYYTTKLTSLIKLLKRADDGGQCELQNIFSEQILVKLLKLSGGGGRLGY